MASSQPNQQSLDDKIVEFVGLTGGAASPEAAAHFLESTKGNLAEAVALYFDSKDDGAEADSDDEVEDNYQGPRTLDGRPAPQASTSSAQKKPAPKKTGLATLSSLGGSGHHHDHDDDDDDDDDDFHDESKGPRDLFAGGEKSGLAVQDPAKAGGARKVMKDILAKAKSNATRPDADSEAGPSHRFHGTGQTLGGEGVESRTIPDPRGQAIPPPPRGPPQERTLHIWQDGFSIDDGELHRFDDPQNAADLEMIRQGRAPIHLMNVRYDEPLDVKLQQHQEDFRQLPKIYRPFGGEGRRLGSPVPGDSTQSTAPLVAPAAAASSTSQTTPAPAVDSSQPTLMLRIQLPDGTRLPARFNSTATIGEVYNFVQGASPATQSRAWVLATTFPSKDHTDRDLVLGEMPEFKRGGNVQVKWT